ncbi:hypothetical protein C0993_002172, partial [Termitomyces sp. T159_Od127]
MSNSPLPEEWDIQDMWTLVLIVYNYKNPVGLGIKMDGTAAKAWESLTNAYGIVSDLAAMGAENTLQATRFTDDADLLAHLADMQTKWKDATEKGAVISDVTF